MTERVDIAAPLREICDRLGLVYENVASLFITPSSAVARIFLLDATGHKYVDETGEAAMEPRRFELAIKTAGPTSEAKDE